MKHRGAFIVVEGVDRAGKTTQCRKLFEKLIENNIPAQLFNFPDRTTGIGKIINEYLTNGMELSPQVIHLLFSANRWELEPTIRKHLLNGVTVIVDRYSFSGVAYTAAKQGTDINLDWLKNPESGLPKPDVVLFLNIDHNALINRPGFGQEKYESSSFQKVVANYYTKLMDQTWQIIDANKTVNELNEELYDIILKVIDKSKEECLQKLW